MELEEIGKAVVASAITVHQTLGPGLLESTYQACLTYELIKQGLQVACEVPLPVKYDGRTIDCAYRIDMLVENCVIVENKVVDQLTSLHTAQLLTYLKLSGLWLGFLLNWNTVRMKYGIRRLVLGENPSNNNPGALRVPGGKDRTG